MPNGKQTFQVEKLKVGIPPRVGNLFYITLDDGTVMTIKQRDRNLLLKNQTYGKQMDNLIKNFKQRDTDANIKKIMEQLEKIDENTQRKSISMYKIKQMMELQMKEF